MMNFKAGFEKLLSRVSDRLARTLAKTAGTDEVDWQGIDEARGRLVQMRFRNGEPAAVGPSYMSDVHRPNKHLGWSSQFSGVRSNDRQAMVRWFAKETSTIDTNKLEKELRDIIYKRTKEAQFFTDDDWYAKQEYQALMLPGVNYAVAPEHPADSTPIRPLLQIDNGESWGIAQ